MGESDYPESWDKNNESEDPYPLLPPEDRLWRHPSEVRRAASNRIRSAAPKFGQALLYRSPRTTLISILLAGLLTGIILGNGASSGGGSSKKSATNPVQFQVELPAQLSSKISKISNAVTQVRTSSGSIWQAAIFVTSSKYLVTSATKLQRNEVLFAKSSGRWKRLSVTALDPLTDSAILLMPGGRSNYVASYLPDSPPIGALDEVVAPSKNNASNRLIMAIVQNTSLPLSLTRNIYLPNAIELSTQVSDIPLGSLVLDPEGDPIGIVVKTLSINKNERIWASPLPSITRVASLISQHNNKLHGFLGVEGLTAALPPNAPFKSGVIVTNVSPNSPAERSGIKTGMFIVAVGSTPTTTLPLLQSVIESKSPGSQISLMVWMAGTVSIINTVLSDHP